SILTSTSAINRIALTNRGSTMKLLAIATVLAAAVWGQTERGNITGSVTDTSDARIPGATVIATYLVKTKLSQPLPRMQVITTCPTWNPVFTGWSFPPTALRRLFVTTS